MLGRRAAAHRRSILRILATMRLCAGVVLAALVATAAAAIPGQSRSPAAPDPSGFVSLRGHVHRLARPSVDAGEAPDTLRMGGLELIIAKTPAQQAALDQLVADQQNPKSSRYHRWLTPAQYGSQFGASDAVIAALSAWLESNGLQTGAVPASRAYLPFTGSKARVEAAFRTPIHVFVPAGERHYANVAAPSVPAALSHWIAAVRGLNDFHANAGAKRMPANYGRTSPTSPAPDTYYSGSGQYPGYVGPTDFATMYNFAPAYESGVTGAGVTVAIGAQSDLDPSVLSTFWAAFGVAGSNFGLPAQQFSSIAVPVADGGTDPGQTMDSNEDEAYLDSEILGALAPGARLILVRDEDVQIAAQYVVNQNLAAILNVSFGQCEADEGANNATINALWEQAATQGITVTVSTADAGVAACTAQADTNKANDVKSNGFAVNGLASTPYDLAVGGTDFDPTRETSFWNSSNQPGTLASALSHIPEIVWNGSCANPIFADAYRIFDPIEFCNTKTLPGGNTANPFFEISGAGAGVSDCTSTDADENCTGGYAQPAWQMSAGIGSLGGRTIPDVAMIATRWLMCSYDTVPCDPTQAPTFAPAATGTVKVLQGTSASTPAVAAIIAMLDQTKITPTLPDGRQGLVNPMLYELASAEYQNPAIEGVCNASQGTPNTSQCVFFDVTEGSNAEPCSVANYATAAGGSLPASTCASESGDTTGIMAINGTQDYAASLGFDVATGLGSINAAALFGLVLPAPGAPTAIASGQTVTLTWAADADATAGFDIYEGTSPGGVSATPIQRNVMSTSTTVTGLQLGQTYVFAIAAVSSFAISPVSSAATVTIVPAAPTGLTVAGAGSGTLSLNWQASSGATSYEVFEATTSGAEGTTPVANSIIGTATTIDGLTAGQQYFFTVAAVDSGGASSSSTEASGTVVPATPSGLVATAGNASVTLSWSAAAGAATYDVYEGTAAGAESTTPVQQGLTAPSANVVGLSNGTKYYFYVEAVDAGGNSAASNEANAVPAAPGGKSGGGALDWLDIALLGLLTAIGRRARGFRDPTNPRGRTR